MAITGIMRAGYVQIRVLDLAAAAEHYENVLGLVRSGTGADGRVYFQGLGRA